MKSLDIMVGDRFGRWTVVGAPVRKKFGEGRGANYPLYYPCRCDCGVEREVRAFKLLSNSRSCGCLSREVHSQKAVHGHNRPGRRTRLYRIWGAMLQRCGNPNNDGFKDYGGRGIVVDPAWHEFVAFAQWALAHGYADNLQIDRQDNDGPYAPSNCRWIDDAGNKRNTSKNRMISALGETKCVTDWALDHRCSVTPSTIRYRLLKLGWGPERSITAPRANHFDAARFAGNHVK